MPKRAPLLLAMLSSGLTTSTTVRLLQLLLAMARISETKIALAAARLGCLRFFTGTEQLALKQATLAATTLTQEEIDHAPRLLLGTAETLGAGPDGRAMAVVAGDQQPTAQQLEDLAMRFGEVVCLGTEATPWPVAVESNEVPSRDADAEHSGLLVVCGDAPRADVAERLAALSAGLDPAPLTLLDVSDAYAAAKSLPEGATRAGPRARSARQALYAQHTGVVHLDGASKASDVFYLEALICGLAPHEPQAAPHWAPLDAIAHDLWRRLDPTQAPSLPAPLVRLQVGDNEVVLCSDPGELVAAWRAAPGEVAVLIDAPTGATAVLEEHIGDLALSELWLEAAQHGLETPRLLSKALASMLRGKIAKSPDVTLCESVQVQAHKLRNFVAEGAQRTALVWLPDALAGTRLDWQRQARVAAARYARDGGHKESRVLVADVGPPPVGQIAPDHRIGAMQAGSDLASGVRQAALGRLSLVGMLPPPLDRRFRRIYFEPGSLLPVRKQRLEYAPAFYMHELEAALRSRRIEALVNLNGPFLAGLQAARLMWSEGCVPLVGVLHSMHVAQLELDQLQVHMAQPLRSYDTFISPSHCGRTVMNDILEQVRERAAHAGMPPSSERPQVAVIPYGIETEIYGGRDRYASRINLGLPLRPLLLVSVMRFARYNKTDLAPLILTLKELRAAGYDVELVLAGQVNDHDEPRRIFTLASELDVGGYLHIKTNLDADDKFQLLAAADVFVSLSDHVQETYGLGVVEAMAAGRPVVASAWNGFRELVREGETGLLVPSVWRAPSPAREKVMAMARDAQPTQGAFDLNEAVACDLEALSSQLRILLDDRELRERMGARAQIVAQQEYNRTRQGEKIVDLIDDVIAASRQATPKPVATLPTTSLYARFGHYASDVAHDDDWLLPSAAASDLHVRAALLYALYAGEVDTSEQEVDRDLLRRLGTEGLSWAAARRPNCDDARLLRALKYGLVSRVPATHKEA